MNHPHDKLFKATFSDQEVAQDFLNHFLPHETLAIIDVPSVTPQKDSFIQRDLKEFYSDMLYRASFAGREGYVYILIEHKSYQDSQVVFQLLQYMLSIWQKEMTQTKESFLPVVLPIVFYTGKQQWENRRTIFDWLGGHHVDATLHSFIPNFEFLFYNISSDEKEFLVDSVKLKSYVQLNQSLHEEDMESVYLIVIELDQSGERAFFKSVITYLFHVSETFSKEVLKERLTMEGRQELMTVAEKLKREGFEIGRAEGKAEGMSAGKQAERRAIALKLLQLNMDEQEIMQVTGLTDKELVVLKEEL